MIITLNINYRTQAGEDVRVNVRHDDGTYTIHPLTSTDGETWLGTINLKNVANPYVDYFYSVYRMKTEVRREWHMMTHRVEIIGKENDSYLVYDIWYEQPEDSFLYSSAFTDCLHRRKRKLTPKQDCRKTLRIKVRAPQLRHGEQLRIVGSVQQLGNWDCSKSIEMYEHDNNEWACTIDVVEVMGETIWFKFIIKHGEDYIWETGNDRYMQIPEIGRQQVMVYEMHPASFPIEAQKFAGTAIPVFSLRSKSSFGVGDFGDLKKMIDWVAKTGQSILQVLPINDTTLTHSWTDSYPYSCVSIYALHPMYCNVNAFMDIKQGEKTLRDIYEGVRLELNALKQVDYERVNYVKTEILRHAYNAHAKTIFASAEYKEWFKEEESWLVPYAQYSVLRDKYHTPDYTQWPDHNVWNEDDRKSLTSPRTKAFREASFYYFVQYILAKQMKEAHEYARQAGVVLKGDIPIGVNRQGCDSWMEPRYFNMNGQAGAPPDEFSVTGQNWGFPTYNWNEMLKDDCAWWVRRFSNMSKYFDAYRIDHVLGFFRIWEVPMPYEIGLMGQFQPALGLTVHEIEQYGLHWDEERFLKPCDEYDWDVLFLRDHNSNDKFHPRIGSQFCSAYNILEDWEKDCYNRMYDDYFYHRNNHFWRLEAMKKLPRLVNATRMLVCAEDLGMVPDCVADVMNELRILSLEIQSMPKETGLRFGKLKHNPYRSVCTISSHDTATLRMWWDEDYERTQDYYHSRLHRGDDAPHPLPGWLARDIIYRHLACPSMLCILTLQDWLSIDEKLRLTDLNAERINIPANPKHYWRYRMHIDLEDLLNAESFNYQLSGLLKETNR